MIQLYSSCVNQHKPKLILYLFEPPCHINGMTSTMSRETSISFSVKNTVSRPAVMKLWIDMKIYYMYLLCHSFLCEQNLFQRSFIFCSVMVLILSIHLISFLSTMTRFRDTCECKSNHYNVLLLTCAWKYTAFCWWY